MNNHGWFQSHLDHSKEEYARYEEGQSIPGDLNSDALLGAVCAVSHNRETVGAGD